MSELFEVKQSLSPFEQWRQEYSLHFHEEIGDEYPWSMWQGEADDPLNGRSTGELYETQEQAIKETCRFLKIPTFDEWRMKGGNSE